MNRPRIERVPDGYAPGYPKALDRDDYAELIAPDHRARLVAAAAAAASMSLGASLGAQDAPAGIARAEAVLAVLSRAGGSPSFWFESTTFQRQRDAQGLPIVVPQIPISFGNSQNGVFDAGRARQLARELFVAYGLKPVTGHRVAANGVEAELDVYEPALQIGVELRGRAPAKQGMFGQIEKEEPAAALDDDERQVLAKQGHRIHCADLAWYPVMDGDQLTPTVAYLASIVAFLNEVTGGPDVDLEAVLDNHRVRTALPDPQAAEGVRVERNGDFLHMHADAATEVTFTIGAGTSYEQRLAPKQRFGGASWQTLDAPPAPGTVLMLQIQTRASVPMRIEQNGERPIRIEAAGPSAFLPPRFDPRRPFSITLLLGEDPVTLTGPLMLVGGKP